VIAFAEQPSRLKRQFLELLDKDKEFRLAVAGYLGLSETLKRLDSVEESIKELLEEVKGLRGGQDRLWENQNKLWEEVRGLRKDVRDVKTTLERVTLSLEEEARSFIAWRLKEALGVKVALDKVFVDALEINVYGVTGDLCVVGEATVRLGLGLVEELLEKVEVLSVGGLSS
jgi:predicted nuclease with TOPRIM domain